ncbi:MAG TPA: SRPBCC family protein [Myxococcota bacterium]
MVDIITETTIARPRAEVAAFVADPDNAPRWYVNIKSVAWRTPKPLAVGTQLAFVAHFLGRRLAYTYEVMEWAPGERFVMRTAEGPFPMETSYLWRDDVVGTHMTLRNRGTPSGFGKLVAPLMASQMRRANENDLAALRTLLELTSTTPPRGR